MPSKYYVVWKGRKPGVYASWDEARAQVDGFAGARYKSFPNRSDAEKSFAAGYEEYVVAQPDTHKKHGVDLNRAPVSLEDLPAKVRNSYAVDSAWNSVSKVMEYRCVKIDLMTELFHQGPFDDSTNNVGEFLAVVHALALFKNQGISSAIYTDSLNAISWVAQGKCKSKLARTEKNGHVFDLIERAEVWLRDNEYSNAVLKWNTEAWGENPADFGRK